MHHRHLCGPSARGDEGFAFGGSARRSKSAAADVDRIRLEDRADVLPVARHGRSPPAPPRRTSGFGHASGTGVVPRQPLAFATSVWRRRARGHRSGGERAAHPPGAARLRTRRAGSVVRSAGTSCLASAGYGGPHRRDDAAPSGGAASRPSRVRPFGCGPGAARRVRGFGCAATVASDRVRRARRLAGTMPLFGVDSGLRLTRAVEG